MSKLILVILSCFSLALSACAPPGKGAGTNISVAPISSQTNGGNGTVSSTLSTGNNTMTVKVSDVSFCSANAYQNEPCVEVTICETAPHASTCQTISNILLDTGSYGFRVFSSAVTQLSLSPVLNANGVPLGECAQFGSGNAWGSVVTANIQLGSETASNVPIQLINSSFSTHPASCTSPYSSPKDAGFNGILGVGLGYHDCPACVSSTAYNYYYACSGATCTPSLVPSASQVTNPVTALASDNNGVALTLPAISTSGANSVTGQLLLGVGTQSNNTPSSSVKTFHADANYYFTTNYTDPNTHLTQTYTSSFLDSGSNFYYLAPSITATTGCDKDFFCPSSVTSFSATIQSATNSNITSTITSYLGNEKTLINSGNMVFNDIGQQTSGLFDWGLPFFLGRTVYVVIDGQSSSLGTGPLWGF